MVEIFRTTVTDHDLAARLVDQIEAIFHPYNAHFDLEDCDRILRISCYSGEINASLLINFLNKEGIQAEILPDEIPISN